MAQDEKIVPVFEEELDIGTRAVKTGSIRVTKKVEHIEKVIELPITRVELTVERVPVNRVVDEPPQMREEDDTVIIPVVEEEIVMKTQMVLKEEIRIHRKRVNDTVKKTITLAKENVSIEHLDPSGAPFARPPSTIDKNP